MNNDVQGIDSVVNTLVDEVGAHQTEIYGSYGDDHYSRAERTMQAINSKFAGHCNQDAADLSKLKRLGPNQILTVMSTMEAAEEVQRGPLGRTIISERIVYKYTGCEPDEELPLQDLPAEFLSHVYLRERKGINVGANIRSIENAWRQAE